ncbi:unnamed protein product, partial [Amoebophrya sp. A25]
ISVGWDRAIHVHAAEVVNNIALGTRRLANAHDGDVLCVAYCPALNVFATGGGDRVIALRELEKLRFLGALLGHPGRITALAFVGLGLLSGDSEGNVLIWRLDAESLKGGDSTRGELSEVALVSRFLNVRSPLDVKHAISSFAVYGERFDDNDGGGASAQAHSQSTNRGAASRSSKDKNLNQGHQRTSALDHDEDPADFFEDVEDDETTTGIIQLYIADDVGRVRCWDLSLLTAIEPNLFPPGSMPHSRTSDRGPSANKAASGSAALHESSSSSNTATASGSAALHESSSNTATMKNATAEIDGSMQAKIAVAQSQQYRRRLSKLTQNSSLPAVAEYITEFSAHASAGPDSTSCVSLQLIPKQRNRNTVDLQTSESESDVQELVLLTAGTDQMARVWQHVVADDIRGLGSEKNPSTTGEGAVEEQEGEEGMKINGTFTSGKKHDHEHPPSSTSATTRNSAANNSLAPKAKPSLLEVKQISHLRAFGRSRWRFPLETQVFGTEVVEQARLMEAPRMLHDQNGRGGWNNYSRGGVQHGGDGYEQYL